MKSLHDGVACTSVDDVILKLFDYVISLSAGRVKLNYGAVTRPREERTIRMTKLPRKRKSSQAPELIGLFAKIPEMDFRISYHLATS